MNFSYVKLTFSVPFQRTIESKKFTGINDLQDVPTKLNSLSRASKTFVVEVHDEEDEVVVKTERYLNEAEEQEEQGPKTGRQNDQSSLIEMQQKEIEELKTRYSLKNPSNSAALQLFHLLETFLQFRRVIIQLRSLTLTIPLLFTYQKRSRADCRPSSAKMVTFFYH